MKKTLVFASLFSLLLLGCGGAESTDNRDTTQGQDSTELDFADMNEISLQDQELNMQLMLPSVASPTGASIEPKVDHDEGDYLWFLSIGQRFQLIIEDYGKEVDKVASEKKRLNALDNIFEIEYLVDEANLIMYRRTLHEGQGGKKTYHCYGQVEVEGYNYVLRSEDEGSLKPIIEDMVKTIRSAKPIGTVAA